jgi:hypothetical protein
MTLIYNTLFFNYKILLHFSHWKSHQLIITQTNKVTGTLQSSKNIKSLKKKLSKVHNLVNERQLICASWSNWAIKDDEGLIRRPSAIPCHTRTEQSQDPDTKILFLLPQARHDTASSWPRTESISFPNSRLYRMLQGNNVYTIWNTLL